MKPVIRHKEQKEGQNRKNKADFFKITVVQDKRICFSAAYQRKNIRKQENRKTAEHQETFFAEAEKESIFLIRGDPQQFKSAE